VGGFWQGLDFNDKSTMSAALTPQRDSCEDLSLTQLNWHGFPGDRWFRGVGLPPGEIIMSAKINQIIKIMRKLNMPIMLI